MTSPILPHRNADLTQGEITLSPFYHSAVNEVTQPDSFRACSNYLMDRWLRDLGPTGYAILMTLRSKCYWNRKTGELRDSIKIAISDIAETCGISSRTVRRELKENKTLGKFVQSQRTVAQDGRGNRNLYGLSAFRVSMDDPIHPSDEQFLIEIIKRKAEESEKQAVDPFARRRMSIGQIDPSTKNSANLSRSADKLTAPPDNLSTPIGQIDRTLKTLDSSLPKKTLKTPAAQDSSLSLSEPEKPLARARQNNPGAFDFVDKKRSRLL